MEYFGFVFMTVNETFLLKIDEYSYNFESLVFVVKSQFSFSEFSYYKLACFSQLFFF